MTESAQHRPAIRDVALIALYLAGMIFAAIWVDGVDGFWLWLFGATSALVGLGAWRALR